MIIGQQCRCNTCGKIGRLTSPSLTTSLKILKAAGWRVTKVATGWNHYCPDCVAKWKKPNPPADPRPLPEMWWQRD